MTYYIYQFREDVLKECNSREDLLRFLSWGNNLSLHRIAHNENDTFSKHYFAVDIIYHKKREEQDLRDLVIYDELWRVINLHEIREWFWEWKAKPYKCDNRARWQRYSGQKTINFRKDPVPWVSNGRQRRRSNGQFNKQYKAKLMEYYDLFPNSGRMRFIDSFWWDYYPPYKKGRIKNWKEHSKKRKQWME